MVITPQDWAGYLPLLIFAGVMLWRFRSIHKARPLRVGTLWILPSFIVLAVGAALAGLRPGLTGWALVALGLLIGSALGFQRARMMRLHVEGEGRDARVMMRQSPAALILILAIFGLRRLLIPAVESGAGGHGSAGALLVTDAMLGFALGVICVQRIVLWRRASAIAREHHEQRGKHDA